MANSFAFNRPNALPDGVHCVLGGYVHTAATNTATITDTNGNTVAQISAIGGTTGGYVGMTPTSGNTNIFQPQSSGQPYTITFTNSGSYQSQYLSAKNAINNGRTTYAESYTFVTEDATDHDYNDSTVFLSWNVTGS